MNVPPIAKSGGQNEKVIKLEKFDKIKQTLEFQPTLELKTPDEKAKVQSTPKEGLSQEFKIEIKPETVATPEDAYKYDVYGNLNVNKEISK